MGTMIELADTLQLTTDPGFPKLLDRDKHVKKPITLDVVAGRIFKFKDKPNASIFQLDPVRVFFVHNIDGKWLFWGHVQIQSLTIEKNLAPDGSWKRRLDHLRHLQDRRPLRPGLPEGIHAERDAGGQELLPVSRCHFVLTDSSGHQGPGESKKKHVKMSRALCLC